LPEGTFESELFGHVKGAFTDARADRIGRFELADRGTLFLDEIANVPLKQQPNCCACWKPARWSASGPPRPRKVGRFACFPRPTADLKVESAEGRFRSDLLFRPEHRGTAHSSAARAA